VSRWRGVTDAAGYGFSMLLRTIRLMKSEYVKAETGQGEGSNRQSCFTWKGKIVLDWSAKEGCREAQTHFERVR
jgi:hypothetical protein